MTTRIRPVDWRTLTPGQRLTPHAVLTLCISLHGDDQDIHDEGGIANMIMDADAFVVGEVAVAEVVRSVVTDRATVEEYAARIAREGTCPPVIVDWLHDDRGRGQIVVLDGNHRLDALALFGRATSLALIAERR